MMNAKKILMLLISLVLIAAMALAVVSCGEEKKADETASANNEASAEAVKVGEGKLTVTVEVVNDKGEHKSYAVSTDADNLGDVLRECEFVEGEESDYGLFIKTVDGLRADYNEDGAYWGIFKNGEMLMTGADDTSIADGEHYELVYTKG